MGCFRYVYMLLAGVIAVVGMGMIEDKDRSLQLQRLPWMLEATQKQMGAVAGYLRVYERAHGHYPTNDEGLLAVKPLLDACDMKSESPNPVIYFCRVRESGVLTRFGDPFIYENRRGIDPRKFADSGATLDTSRRYSVRVDKDVYVWSVGARQACQTLALWRPTLHAAMVLVGLIVVGLAVLFVRNIVPGRQAGEARRWGEGAGTTVAGILLAILIPAGLFPMFARTCYKGSVMWDRKPKLTSEYKALLTKYHSRGVINDATYKKITAAMDMHDDY